MAITEADMETTIDPLHLKMVVDGEAVEAEAAERYCVFNPANGERVGSAPFGRSPDARDAISAAEEALSSWRSIRVSERAGALVDAIGNVSANGEQLARLLTREQGKPLAEAKAEIASFVSRMLFFAKLAQSTADGRLTMLARGGDGARSHSIDPKDGVSVALVAWNFPVGLLAKKIGPVLVAGGTVIVKPAYSTPLTTVRVTEVMTEALPPGVLNCVTGRGDVIGAALARDPRVARVYLTGSDATGAAIQKGRNAGNADVVLELAGSDSMIVCSDADLSKALAAVVEGRLRNTGQMCSAVKRLYLAAEIYESFSNRLIEYMRHREPGDGLVPALAPRIRMGPLHNTATRERIEAQLSDGAAAGGRIVLGGRRPPMENGFFFEPTLVENVPDSCRLVTEEVFGPVLPVFKVSGIEAAVERANRGASALNVSIWTRDRQTAKLASHRLACGRIWINRLSFSTAENPANDSGVH